MAAVRNGAKKFTRIPAKYVLEFCRKAHVWVVFLIRK